MFCLKYIHLAQIESLSLIRSFFCKLHLSYLPPSQNKEPKNETHPFDLRRRSY